MFIDGEAMSGYLFGNQEFPHESQTLRTRNKEESFVQTPSPAPTEPFPFLLARLQAEARHEQNAGKQATESR